VFARSRERVIGDVATHQPHALGLQSRLDQQRSASRKRIHDDLTGMQIAQACHRRCHRRVKGAGHRLPTPRTAMERAQVRPNSNSSLLPPQVNPTPDGVSAIAFVTGDVVQSETARQCLTGDLFDFVARVVALSEKACGNAKSANCRWNLRGSARQLSDQLCEPRQARAAVIEILEVAPHQEHIIDASEVARREHPLVRKH
jgi:hypothetical protein